MTYKQPEVLSPSYTCPHCGAIAQQFWWGFSWDGDRFNDWRVNAIRVGKCAHCDKKTLWIEKTMYFPDTGTAPNPNSEMPESVKKLYNEAASIQSKSPRGAGALLRLAIQVLCKELGENGQNINVDISSLVKKGLPDIVQQSLDIVRVTGNDAVHPGQIDVDDPEIVNNLFKLINLIVEYMIALPKQVSGIYGQLPKDKLAGINQRDKK
jgi:hypothetical protein